jgi:hypothetical protein
MTTNELIQICIKTAKAYPKKDCLSINSFMAVHDMMQYANPANVGGENIWIRETPHGGIYGSEQKIQLPTLLLQKIGSDTLTHTAKICDKFLLNIVGNTTCLECADCKKSVIDIVSDLQTILLQVFNEIHSNFQYEVTFLDGSVKTIWATEIELSAIPYASYNQLTFDKNFASAKMFQIQTDVDVNGSIAVGLEIEACHCILPIFFNYSSVTTANMVGVATCSTCN